MNIDHSILEKSLNAVIVSQKDHELLFRIEAHNIEEWESWFESFCEETNTNWHVQKTFPNIVQMIFSKTYVCQFLQHRKKVKKVATGCPAKLRVKIMRNTKHTRCRDKLRVRYPCFVTLHNEHNHSTTGSDIVSQLSISKKTKNIFLNYYKAGFSPSQSAYMNSCMVAITRGIHFKDNGIISPAARVAYQYWSKWRREYHTCKSDDLNDLKLYVLESTSKMHLKEFEDFFVLTIVTPLMERVHFMAKQSSELVYVHSMSQKHCTVTIFLCQSAMGPLPLGVLISSGKVEQSFFEGFESMKEILGTMAFCSVNQPQAFMTNDCAELKSALQKAWPESRQFLSAFDVLQGTWGWLLTSENAIQEMDRHELMNGFKRVLYAGSNTSYNQALEELKETSRNYKKFINYLNRLHLRKEEWCASYRKGIVSRKEHGLACCESFIKCIREIVGTNLRVFKATHLVRYFTEVYGKYFESRIMNLALKQKKEIAIEMPIVTADNITRQDDWYFTVQCDSTEYEDKLVIGKSSAKNNLNQASVSETTDQSFLMELEKDIKQFQEVTSNSNVTISNESMNETISGNSNITNSLINESINLDNAPVKYENSVNADKEDKQMSKEAQLNDKDLKTKILMDVTGDQETANLQTASAIYLKPVPAENSDVESMIESQPQTEAEIQQDSKIISSTNSGEVLQPDAGVNSVTAETTVIESDIILESGAMDSLVESEVVLQSVPLEDSTVQQNNDVRDDNKSIKTEGKVIVHHVNTVGGLCTCFVGVWGKMCRHQRSIIHYMHLAVDELYNGSVRERQAFANVALGENAPDVSQSLQDPAKMKKPNIQDENKFHLNTSNSSVCGLCGEQVEFDYTEENEDLLNETIIMLHDKIKPIVHTKKGLEILQKIKTKLSEDYSALERTFTHVNKSEPPFLKIQRVDQCISPPDIADSNHTEKETKYSDEYQTFITSKPQPKKKIVCRIKNQNWSTLS